MSIGRIYANGLVPDSRGDEPDDGQVALCRRWIRCFVRPRKTVNRSRSSYGLKHDVERWTAQTPGEWRNVDNRGREWFSDSAYVSNGAFIKAAVLEGYSVRQIEGGPNAHFDMSFGAKGAG